jgi:hypothetical protein
MIEITEGVAREYAWVPFQGGGGEWVLVEDSPWNEDVKEDGR